MIWLLIAVGFHLAHFVTTGWWFLAWVVIEVALLRILFTPRLDDWHRANANPARIVVTMLAATVAAPLVFHPPELTWLDSPVVYGYEVEATGESGTVYHVPNAAFAPHAQELALARLQLGPAVPASGPYGGVPTVEELEELEAVTDLAQLRAHEATLGPPTLTVKSEELVKSFMEQVNRGGRHEWFDIGPPSVTWTSRGEPSFDYDEPLTRLEVWLVRGIHDGDETIDARELVLVLTVNEGGQVLVAGEPTLGSSPVGTDGAEDAGGGDDAGGADPDTGASGNGTQTTNPAGDGDGTGATDPPPTNATVTSPACTG
jgi:hypothetical protein